MRILTRAALAALCFMAAACGGGPLPVGGTLEGTSAPAVASRTLKDEIRAADPATDGRFECLLEEGDVRVWSMLRTTGAFSSMGFGIVVGTGESRSVFPDIQHGMMPAARLDRNSGTLWLTGADMEGTGVRVERLYRLQVGEDGARIVATLDPYTLQQALLGRLGYRIQGQEITLYADGKPLATVTNHEQDMGDFFEQAVWIGEQLLYDISDPVRVRVIPGLCFNTGKVLFYDDMPILSVPVTLTADGFTLGDITLEN